MLIGISPLISPDLLALLSQMGHGDEIVLADAHFPGHSLNKNVLRADGVRIAELLDAILPLFALDTYVEDPVVMMEAMGGDVLDPTVEESYRSAIDKHQPETPLIKRIDKFIFYERTKDSMGVVMTSETAKYGNILLKKGVTPV